MNPAVSVGLFLSGAQALDLTMGYIIFQLMGATTGGLIARGLVDSNSTSIPNTFALVLPNSENQSHIQSMLTETFFAFILILLILVAIVETGASKNTFGPLAVGIWVTTSILAGGKLSGASMNPARAFGTALAFNDGWNVVWIYFSGGVLGAILASLGYRFFFTKRALRRPFLTVLFQSKISEDQVTLLRSTSAK
jgi:glycerol uptake facilitator-like aquaporin